MLPEWWLDRGEVVSFVVVILMLVLSARAVARTLGVSSGVVEDQFWWGGLAFLVMGRLGYVMLATPELLLDVVVLIRFADGVDPVVGAAASLVVIAWRGRGEGRPELAMRGLVAVVGLMLASVAYGLACPLREACFGATTSTPWGFPMHGLAEPRFATPLIESVVLLAVLAVTVRYVGRLSMERMGWGLLAALAVVRVAMMPISASGVDVAYALVLLVVAVGSGLLAWKAGGGVDVEGEGRRGQET